MPGDAERQPLWTRYFILICSSGLICSSVMRLLDSTLVIFATDIGASKSYGGLLTTTFTLGAISANFFFGRVIDRAGRRIILFCAALSFSGATLGFLVFHMTGAYLMLRFLQGISKAAATIATSAMVADILPASRMGEGMGYFGLGSTLASAFGPALGLLLISGGEYGRMFSACALLYAAVAVLALQINYEKRQPVEINPGRDSEKNMPQVHGIWKYFERGALPAAVVQFCYNAGMAGILLFLTIYAQEELGDLSAGSFFTMSAGAMLLSRLCTGRLVDRYGVLVVLVPGFFVSIVGHILLAYFCRGNVSLFLAAGALHGLGHGAIFPALSALAVLDSPKQRRGVASSTLFFGMDLGVLVTSALGGIIIDHHGYTELFCFGILLYVIGMAYSMIYLGNRSRACRAKKLGIVR